MSEGHGKPRWDITDVFLVYFGVLIFTLGIGTLGSRLNLLDQGLQRFIIMAGAQFVITIMMVGFFTMVSRGASLADLGLQSTARINYITYGVLGGLLMVIGMLILSWPISVLQPNLQPQSYERMLSASSSGYLVWLLFFIGAVLAPVSEELFYRAMIYPVLRGYAGPVWGAILAGLVFGLAHWDVWRTLPLALGGMILCYIYEKTGSIYVSMVTHGVWNGVMAALVLLKVQA